MKLYRDIEISLEAQILILMSQIQYIHQYKIGSKFKLLSTFAYQVRQLFCAETVGFMKRICISHLPINFKIKQKKEILLMKNEKIFFLFRFCFYKKYERVFVWIFVYVV